MQTSKLDKRHPLFILFFGVYLTLSLNDISSRSNSDYPFGADVGRYRELSLQKECGLILSTKHPLPVVIIGSANCLLGPFKSRMDARIAVKVTYALFGALSVLLAYSVAERVRLGSRFLLPFALIYGFSASIMYFSSVPETYMITTFFTSLYLLSFLSFAEEANFRTTFALTSSLILCVLSEIFLISLVMIPLVYFNTALFRDKGLRAGLPGSRPGGFSRLPSLSRLHP